MTQTIETTDSNDIALEANGSVSIVGGLYAVLLNCRTAIQAQRGEMQFAIDKGMPTRATAWDDYNPIQFEAAARVILRAVSGVVDVPSFTITRDASILRYNAVIQTIYGQGELNG